MRTNVLNTLWMYPSLTSLLLVDGRFADLLPAPIVVSPCSHARRAIASEHYLAGRRQDLHACSSLAVMTLTQVGWAVEPHLGHIRMHSLTTF